ncbi:hypothetical protein EDC01DRAFT_657817 [Geopyxis carbonaria]|nr:hypothetical protein EDC01DRAFT_657817 [Geopyxis carbonaria]
MASTALASTPPASSVGADANTTTMSGPPATSRQMRLQVSYTFDDASQAHCLARWPHLVSTPTVQVDEDLLVGAVELKTCILSIISASPELVATLSQDFCVYAFDFSEPGFPLVGCGMLSWTMLNAQNSSTRIMITGRVRRNKFGVFNDDGVKETLEVKFRLHKVDTFTQEQFVKSVHAYTALSKMLPGNFDASAWSNFVQAHPQILNMAPSHTQINKQNPAAHAPPPPAPAPQTQSINWKEGTPSASEDSGQPPKKKQKTTAPRRPPKTTYSRKKATIVGSSPRSTPQPQISNSPEEFRQEALEPQQSVSQSSQGSTFLKPSLSRDSSMQRGVFTQAEPSPSAMASSPPAQSEGGDATGILSPAPTSPCLPSLPAVRATESNESNILETLFEEPEIRDDGELAVYARATGNPFSGPATENTSCATAAQPRTTKVSNISNFKPSIKPKDGLLTSDSLCLPTFEPRPIVPEPPRITEKKPKPPRTAADVKSRIELQLLEAIKSGKMPNYCNNCGAIETAVWRRVRLSDAQPEGDKAPEKEPKQEERATSEAAASRRKKEKEDSEKEVLLCNACGLWFWSHKTMRPQTLWDTSKQDAPKVSKGNARKRKKSSNAPTPPASKVLDPPAEPIVLEDPTPRPTKKATTPSANRSTTKNSNSDWNDAISEGRRAAQSSPVVHGSASSPIDLDADIDGVKSPRRLLFPGARTPARAKALAIPLEVIDKENEPPTIEGEDKTPRNELACPKTPTRERTTPRQFRTPLRSATRSITGANSLNMSPCRSSRRGTNDSIPPATPERRLLKSQQQRLSLSPTAGLLEKLLADDAPVMAGMSNLLPFDLDDDFMNTDLTMPSSPPQFNLFEDDGALSDRVTNGDWSDFLPSTPGFNIEDLLEAHKDGQNGMTVDLSAFIEEHTNGILSTTPTATPTATAMEGMIEIASPTEA